MLYFDVALMMNFHMRSLDERLLLFNRNNNSMSGAPIGGNCHVSLRVTFHHRPVSILV